MAQVITGIFPKALGDKGKKDDKPVASYVLHLSIAFSDPLIWRRIQVPGELTLAQLHQVQAALVALGVTEDHTALEKPAETTGTAASNAASRRVEVVLSK